MGFFDRASKFINGAKAYSEWLGTSEPVPAAQAQVRADTCLFGDNGQPCPKNQHSTFDAEFTATIRAILKLKGWLGLRVVGEKKLHTCQVCSCPLRTKVFMGIDIVVKGVDGKDWTEFPDYCWIRKEANK